MAQAIPRGAIIVLTVILIGSTLSGQAGYMPGLDIKDLDGQQLNRQMLLDNGPVLIDFWALWCAPCLKALPHLEQLQAQYIDSGLTVILINIDSESSRSKVRRFIKTRRYQAKTALDPTQALFRRMNGMTLPYTLLIDVDGRVTYRHIGYNPGDEKRLAVEVAQLFAPTDVESFNTVPPGR